MADHSIYRLAYKTIFGDEADGYSAGSGAGSGRAISPLQNRLAQLLFTGMYLGTALWVVVHG